MNQPEIRSIDIKDCEFGSNVVLVNPVNIYGSQLDSNVFVGPFVEIQSGVRIGEFTKVQSHAFICEGVDIGARCFVSHGVMFVNDLFADGKPAGGDKSKWKYATVGNDVSIGTGSVILPVSICNDVVVGAGSVVTNDIDKPGIYCGNPARFLRNI